jgi:ABC-type lipoprotein export system ATPase subunit
LINGPEVVLIDEPTANLDLANKEGVLALLSRKQKKGTTIVVATHDQFVTKHATKVEIRPLTAELGSTPSHIKKQIAKKGSSSTSAISSTRFSKKGAATRAPA